MTRLLKTLLCTRGATAVEYGLILALIFMAIAGTVSQVATSSNNMWNNVSKKTGAAL